MVVLYAWGVVSYRGKQARYAALSCRVSTRTSKHRAYSQYVQNGEGRGSCRSRGSSTGSTTLTDDSGVFDKSPPPARVQKKRLVCDIPLTTPPNTGIWELPDARPPFSNVTSLHTHVAVTYTVVPARKVDHIMFCKLF